MKKEKINQEKKSQEENKLIDSFGTVYSHLNP